MGFCALFRFGWLPALLTLATSCSTAPSPNGPAERAGEIAKAEFPRWGYFITITPEDIKTARSAPECRPADEDTRGHWGSSWEGDQLSIRLQKEVFTNGEPIVACVTLRNASDRMSYLEVVIPQEERDTKIRLMHDGQRVLGEDDPKPGESFQQRLTHIRRGSAHVEPLPPGTQRQFFRDLSKLFDLNAAGTYTAQAERKVITYYKIPDRPGYLRGLGTNLVSGIVTFRMVDSQHEK